MRRVLFIQVCKADEALAYQLITQLERLYPGESYVFVLQEVQDRAYFSKRGFVFDAEKFGWENCTARILQAREKLLEYDYFVRFDPDALLLRPGVLEEAEALLAGGWDYAGFHQPTERPWLQLKTPFLWQGFFYAATPRFLAEFERYAALKPEIKPDDILTSYILENEPSLRAVEVSGIQNNTPAELLAKGTRLWHPVKRLLTETEKRRLYAKDT